VTELVVLLEGKIAGTLEQDRAGDLTFRYLDEWLNNREATPLSLSMPLTGDDFGDSTVKPYLWGLLPDNEAVLQRWGREFAVSARNPFAILAQVGEDCAGAVQIVQHERLDAARASGTIEPVSDAEIAAALRELGRDPTAWLNSVATGQFSLAGAQPKFALQRRGESWFRPSGSEPTTHIFKRGLVELPDHDLNEHLCLNIARRVSIPAAITEVMRFEDERALVSTRYDRQSLDDTIARVHQEDLCQSLSVLPQGKYQNEGGPSPLDIVGLFRRTLSSTEANTTVLQFMDALALNWILGATDAHAKNYSVLLSGPDVVLAPLYDVASILSYPSVIDMKAATFAMKIGGAYRLRDITARDWRRLATDLELEDGLVLGRVAELSSQVARAAIDVSAEASTQTEGDVFVAELGRSIAERATECARLLG
jgi:serine/threonine-protein kinase HipA